MQFSPFCEIQVENHRMMTGVCNSTRQIFTSRSHSIRGLCSSSGPGPGSFIKGAAKSQRTAASFAAKWRLVSAVSSRWWWEYTATPEIEIQIHTENGQSRAFEVILSAGFWRKKLKSPQGFEKKIEIWQGFGFHWGFWIESPWGICWFWLQRGVLSLKRVHLCCKCDGN